MALPTRLLAALPLFLLCSATLAAPPATQPAVRFLTAAETNQALLDNSDNYLSNLQTLEMAAKTGKPITGADLPAQREEFRRRYATGGMDFTDEEKTELTAAVAAIHSLLAADYPLFVAQPFSLAKVNDTVEHGLSHTRGDHIILPQAELTQILRVLSRRGNRDTARLLALCPLLVHEQLHVVQRRHPQPFAKLYERWGFVHAGAIAPCPWLDARQVANPDGVDLNWVFAYPDIEAAAPNAKRYLLPRVIFDPGPNAAAVLDMPADFRFVLIDLTPTGQPNQFKVVTDAAGRPTSRELSKVKEYIDAVQGSRYSFHPNEAAAELFQHLFTRGYVLPRTGAPRPLSETDQRVQAALKEVLK